MFEQLQSNDELMIERSIQRTSYGYQEGVLSFAPSYKVLPKTNMYDFKRSPAWTDRVLYRSNDNILNLMNYDSNNLLMQSDHRPVYAQFLLMFDEKQQCHQEVVMEKRERNSA